MELHARISLVIFWNLFDSSLSECVNSMCENFEICKSEYQDFEPFFEEETGVYVECCNLCASMEKCASFNYDVKTHKCSLLENASKALKQMDSSIYGKYKKTSGQGSKHVCRTRPCKPDQVCVTAMSGNGYICLQGSTCLNAPPTENMKSERGFLALTSGQAFYTCDTGFQRIEGSGHSECTEEGKWTRPSLVCKEIDCAHPPAQEHQTVISVKSTLYLDRVEYTCANGYNQIKGSGASSCQADGTWSVPTLKCHGIDCEQPPTFEHQKVTFTNSTMYMSRVEYTCNTGYRRSEGRGTSSCQAYGKWSTPTLKCLGIDCEEPPTRENMKMNSVKSTLYQASVEYTCDTGYNATESSGTSSCQENGSWSVPTLKCQVVDCGMPEGVENMEATGVSWTTYMSRMTFNCKTGFRSDGGDPTIECMANGNWSQSIFKCNIVDCETPPGLDIHNVSFVDTTYQSTAVYQCGLGYYTQGNGPSVCKADGKWSETCKDIPNLRGTDTLEATTGPLLECRNVMSEPVQKKWSFSWNLWTYTQPSASCDVDEILSGCSVTAEKGTQVSGSWVSTWISTKLRCSINTPEGARSVARCCKIPGIKCEYIGGTTSSASCYKNFQLLDCTCSEYYTMGNCETTMTNSSCEFNSTMAASRYAVCCTHDQLACHVKQISMSSKTGDVEVTATCEHGEVMTACSAFNTNTQKALIEVRNGVETCVVNPGSGSLSTLKAYVSCCKLK